MNRSFFCSLMLMTLLAALSSNQRTYAQDSAPAAPANAATFQQQLGYALGLNIGADFRRNQIDIDPQALASGIADAIAGTPPKMNEQQIAAVMQQFQKQMEQKQQAAMQKAQGAAGTNKQEEVAFLAKNKMAEGVQTTASGLQYKVLKQGNGASPTLQDTVSCHYRGTLLSGKEFDSSYSRGEPTSFPVGGVIAGWTEALQKMRVGDKWQLFIPSELAYGMNPPGPPIEAGSMLIFEIELLGIRGS